MWSYNLHFCFLSSLVYAQAVLSYAQCTYEVNMLSKLINHPQNGNALLANLSMHALFKKPIQISFVLIMTENRKYS